MALNEWLMQYDELGTYDELPTVVVNAFLYTVIETPDGFFDTCEIKSEFGQLNIFWNEEDEIITIHLELFFDLFTKEAYPYFGTDVYGKLNVIDIGPECRKHNRDLLSNSLESFAKNINGKVIAFYPKTDQYINENGFSDDCENEKIYDTKNGKSFKTES